MMYLPDEVCWWWYGVRARFPYVLLSPVCWLSGHRRPPRPLRRCLRCLKRLPMSMQADAVANLDGKRT